MSCRPDGTVSVIGVYVGFPDKLLFGAGRPKLAVTRKVVQYPALHSVTPEVAGSSGRA